MSHQWDRGVLTSSSWHGLEDIGVMVSAQDMLEHAYESGAWPIGLCSETLTTQSGILSAARSIVATYRNHPRREVGVNSEKYQYNSVEAWAELITAAVENGCCPTGCFSLAKGSRILATFEVGDRPNGETKSYLLIFDNFDGSGKLFFGFTEIRVVCANTLALAISKDGAGFVGIRHTTGLTEKVKILQENMVLALQQGNQVRALYEEAQHTHFASPEAAQEAFELLWPTAQEDDSKNKKTRLENNQKEARRALANPINTPRCRLETVADLWNAATFLVDRTEDGAIRDCRGEADRLESLLFGQRSKRIQEIVTQIEVIMRDGSIQTMTQTEAIEAGVTPAQVGRAVVADLLGGEPLS